MASAHASGQDSFGSALLFDIFRCPYITEARWWHPIGFNVDGDINAEITKARVEILDGIQALCGFIPSDSTETPTLGPSITPSAALFISNPSVAPTTLNPVAFDSDFYGGGRILGGGGDPSLPSDEKNQVIWRDQSTDNTPATPSYHGSFIPGSTTSKASAYSPVETQPSTEKTSDSGENALPNWAVFALVRFKQ